MNCLKNKNKIHVLGTYYINKQITTIFIIDSTLENNS